MTPYRSAPVDGTIADPSRARLGLTLACAGSLACFIGLMHIFLAPAVKLDIVLLLVGGSVLSVGVAYASLDAPAGRVLLVASAVVFAVTFFIGEGLTGDAWRAYMGVYGWPARYIAMGGIAAGLLLRLRRSRPGTSGALLRLAAILSTWWGVQWLVASWLGPDAEKSLYPEALSRASYLFLAIGMLDVRRYLGTVPRSVPARTDTDSAREIATTRVCLAAVSVAIALVVQRCTWHSTWTVIVSHELVAAVLGFTTIPFLMHVGSKAWAIAGLGFFAACAGGLLATERQDLAILAIAIFGASSLAIDVGVATFLRRAGGRSIVAGAAIFLHLAWMGLAAWQTR